MLRYIYLLILRIFVQIHNNNNNNIQNPVINAYVKASCPTSGNVAQANIYSDESCSSYIKNITYSSGCTLINGAGYYRTVECKGSVSAGGKFGGIHISKVLLLLFTSSIFLF